MDLPEAHERGVREPGDRREDPLLLGPAKLRLEPDHRIMLGGEVVLTELNDRVRPRSVRGSIKPTGFIGPNRSVSTRVAPSPRSEGIPRSTASCRTRASALSRRKAARPTKVSYSAWVIGQLR
jgi:hypothetical protein